MALNAGMCAESKEVKGPTHTMLNIHVWFILSSSISESNTLNDTFELFYHS